MATESGPWQVLQYLPFEQMTPERRWITHRCTGNVAVEVGGRISFVSFVLLHQEIQSPSRDSSKLAIWEQPFFFIGFWLEKFEKSYGGR
jgi:hypothetical protein